MPRIDQATLGAPCWIDLFTSDRDASRKFYGELFGWTAEEPNEEFGGYINLQKDGERIAGCMGNDGSSGAPDAWSVYLATADAKATEASARAHGAQIVVSAMEVGDLGHMLLMADPGGAMIGAWQSGEHTGFKEVAEPDTPNWFELRTSQYQKSINFYEEVFGWDTHVESDTEEFRYSTFGQGEDSKAGVMDISGSPPEGVPSHWIVYFGCDDTDKAAERVVELGGTVSTEVQDSPYGRVVQVADPTGAQFMLVGA